MILDWVPKFVIQILLLFLLLYSNQDDSVSVTIENSNEEVTIDVSDDKGENQNSQGEVIINAGKEDTKGVSDETEGDEDEDGEDEEDDDEDDDDEEFEDYESMLESMRNVLGKTSGMCFLIPFIRSAFRFHLSGVFWFQGRKKDQ